MKKSDHVVVAQTPPNYTLRCLRCGQEHIIHLPVTIDMMLAQMEAFAKLHKDCEDKTDVTHNDSTRQEHEGND